MLRFFVVIFCHLITASVFLIKLTHYVKIKDQLDENFKYGYCRHVVMQITKLSRVKVVTKGEENLPKDQGYVMYPNHQSKFDALAIINAHSNPLSIVIKDERSHAPMLNQLIELTNSKRLNMNKPRESVNTFVQIGKEIQNGSRYLIFPEGEWRGKEVDEIKNFNTGCMSFLNDSKCPIVPISLVDTYKVYGKNSLKKVTCYVNFLEPITYEQYKDLTRKEIAFLVKQRIINDIQSNYNIDIKDIT